MSATAAPPSPNLLDRAIATLSPRWAVRRFQARAALAYYEAVKTTRLRRLRTKDGSGDMTAVGNARNLRVYARDLERNHDISRGALDRLVQNVVGPSGIAIEPQPRNLDGEIHEDLAWEILALWRNWVKRPEVTWQHSWPSAQRMMARAWLRDGDSLAQRLTGKIGNFNHGTDVPYSLELLEADNCPFDFNDDGRSIVQGVERSGWGRPLAYWLYKTDPSKLLRLTTVADLKRVPAERMLHVKLVDRMQQARGISIFASVITRLDDVKDYEESERIAAKVAASMAAYIKKGLPEEYTVSMEEDGVTPKRRDMKFRPGMIFDDLNAGEEIGMIDSKRPNPEVENYRKGQLRAAAAGIGISYSSFARDYNGTYSAQRQELVESFGAYGVLSGEFGDRVVYPVYEDFLNAALLSGQLTLPKDLDPRTLDDCILIPPQMPWIDPEKEATAWMLLERAGYASGPEIIRRRGQNPRDVLEQEANWRQMQADKGFTANLSSSNQAAPAPNQNSNARGSLRAQE
jgi:lambda family phage portal protein